MKKNNSYKPTRKNWVKFWVDDWLTGTTRFELSPNQRSIFIDLLALAGRSRFPGIIASGKYGNDLRGYPINYLAGTLVYDLNEFKEAIDLCVTYGKVEVSKQNHDGKENIIIYIKNWDKYQSEYQRQKKSRDVRSENMNLPEYINSETWDDYVDMREEIKKPLTKQGAKLALKKLEKCRKDGDDVNEILEKSTMHSWQGLFGSKDKDDSNGNRKKDTSQKVDGSISGKKIDEVDRHE